MLVVILIKLFSEDGGAIETSAHPCGISYFRRHIQVPFCHAFKVDSPLGIVKFIVDIDVILSTKFELLLFAKLFIFHDLLLAVTLTDAAGWKDTTIAKEVAKRPLMCRGELASGTEALDSMSNAAGLV